MRPASWIEQRGQAAGDSVTLPFWDLFEPGLVFVTDQYWDQHGVLFTDGDDFVQMNPSAYPNDGVGLNGLGFTITIEFDPPIHWVAAEMPACDTLRLFSKGRQILEVDNCLEGFTGAGSTTPIDQVVIYDGSSCPCIDDAVSACRTLRLHRARSDSIPRSIREWT